MENEKVVQQQTPEISGDKPPDVQTPVKGPELSAEQKAIIGLKAENKRLREKSSEDNVSTLPTDDTPDEENETAWAAQKKRDKQILDLTRKNRHMESELAQGKLNSAKAEASREHGVPMELLEDAKSPEEIYKRINQWYVDLKSGDTETPKTPPSRPETLEGGGKGNPSAKDIHTMSPENFEKLKQSLRVKK